jgi:hypothetical protein
MKVEVVSKDVGARENGAQGIGCFRIFFPYTSKN